VRTVAHAAAVLCLLSLTQCSDEPSEASHQTLEQTAGQKLVVNGDNCRLSSYDGHSYWFCSSLRSWVDASSKCTALGAALGRIDSPRENEFVQHNVPIEMWIGANDRSSEKRWVWAAGGHQFSTGASPIAGIYSKWAVGEPNDNLGIEDCAVATGDGTWNDQSCTLTKGYVCESSSDLCPAETAKTQPGECGCATPDIDSDGDAVSDCADECPGSALTATAGACGCPTLPKASGTECSDGLCSAATQCNGAGLCGSPQVCVANPNCSYERRGNSEYLLCLESKTFDQARAFCTSKGMDILSIESRDEDDFIYNRAAPLGTHWVGAQAASAGSWKWAATQELFYTNGDAINGKYINWHLAQPGLSTGTCAVRDATFGKWTGVSCGSSANYVCELQDRCPQDPNKRAPGKCGCGRADTDNDANGTIDCESLTQGNTDTDLDAVTLSVAGRPQGDCTAAAVNFMEGTMTFDTYVALSIDREEKFAQLLGDKTVAAAIAAGDRDGDLVPDSTDQCPNTPLLTPTDNVGCTDPARPDVPNGDEVRALVNDMRLIQANSSVGCSTTTVQTPELVSGYINNTQIGNTFLAVFFRFDKPTCPVRLRVEAQTSDLAGWPYASGSRILYFETIPPDFLQAMQNGQALPGVQAVKLTQPTFGNAYDNLWDRVLDQNGHDAHGTPAVRQSMQLRVMAVYADGRESEWSNNVELRAIGTR
jgi:hypothetical protein